jgi:hypothetical protein
VNVQDLRRWDWFLLPLLVTLLICGTHLLVNAFLLDYTPAAFPMFAKTLQLSEFRSTLTFAAISSIAALLGLSSVLVPLLLFGLLLVSYACMKRLTAHKYIAFLLFAFNPFVYSKLMSGQLGVLSAYLLLPMYLFFLLTAAKSGFRRKEAIKLALAAAITTSFQQQFMFLNGIILIVTYGVLLADRKWRRSASFWGMALVPAMILLLSTYWLQGVFSNQLFANIDATHAEFFSVKLSEGVPALVKVLGMWGFWRENAYITTYAALPLWLWYLLTALIIGTFLIGYSTHKDRRQAHILFILWWIGVILAVGISHPYTRPLFELLFGNMPLFNGFRDSHKFVALVALAYALLCPSGIYWVMKKLRARKAKPALRILVPAFFVLCILVYTYPLLGLWGQVQPTSYPDSYEQANAFLKSQTRTGSIVYLPYYDYLTYNWTLRANPDGRIANPINRIVEPVVITNPGPWGTQTKETRAIDACIATQSLACLRQEGVQFVLLDHCFINSQEEPWLQGIVHASACITIYKIGGASSAAGEIPLRFMIGVMTSMTTFIVLFLLLQRRT